MELITSKEDVFAVFTANKRHFEKMGASLVEFSDFPKPAINLGFKNGDEARRFDRWANQLHAENPLRQALLKAPFHRQIIATP
ncbi:MAG: hypothetical protein M3N08_06220 [Pseudomonadota bacterium]|nr:hypothetical protein [Pseudomonadota bacterium]